MYVRVCVILFYVFLFNHLILINIPDTCTTSDHTPVQHITGQRWEVKSDTGSSHIMCPLRGGAS